MSVVISSEERHDEVAFSNAELTIEALEQAQLQVANAKSLIINLERIERMEDGVANFLLSWSNSVKPFKSFKLCAVNEEVSKALPEDLEILPTLTEAQDLIFMEEVERELGL